MSATDMPLNQLSATEAAQRIASGALTSEALVEACLARIAAREPEVQAWATLDPELALREARARDKGPRLGPLHGVPIAVKDILDTANLATEYGSPIYKGHHPRTDAACIARLRAAGAVVLGKAVTCELAGFAPSPTRNPQNLAHTPGGSSSGTAAAVADFMVPVGLGTQTGGSILRPAAYCGVIGYKPSFGTISRAGLKLASDSLDTIGLIARTIDDIALLADVLAAREPAPVEPLAPLRIGLCRTFLWDKARPETQLAVVSAAETLASHVEVRDLALPQGFHALVEARAIIDDYDRARTLAHEWQNSRGLLSPHMTATIERGLAIPHARYGDAVRSAAASRALLPSILAEVDLVLTPCTTGEAPLGLESTGDSTFQGLWTLLHVPTIGLPTHQGPNGLPVGIQLVAPLHEDLRLLRFALWVEHRLARQYPALARPELRRPRDRYRGSPSAR
jgi:Asp-tRNA(Asn)/Glu-tRNA(Gln) amidotransferase A subunit family amidase